VGSTQLKRSSRLIILVGVLLAVAAFGGILWYGSQGGTTPGSASATVATTTKIVQAAADISLGTTITANQVVVKEVPVASAPVDAFSDPSQVVGRIARQQITAGDTITTADFASGNTAQGDQIVKALKPGFRAIAVQVDQNSGVGTLIQPGDRVDLVMGIKIQTYVAPTGVGAAASQLPQPVPGGPQLSVKDIIQNLEVLGTLTPPVTTTTTGQQQTQPQPSAGAAVGLTGQQMIVILAVTAQQAEVIKYAQVNAADNADTPISLILRAPADASAPPDKTSGIVLKTLLDQYGVLPPVLLEGTLPTR
jgi:Flp pilus assembly protein CpaB